MEQVSVLISGPHDATIDDLINGGREAVSRRGYTVGDSHGFEKGQNRFGQSHATGFLELDERAQAELELDGVWEVSYNGYTVTAESQFEDEVA
jgi:hypothetical protein